MIIKALMVAAAFALPFAATAAGDKAAAGGDKAAASSDKSAAGGDKAAAGATKSDGGAEAMFKALDKNKDGFVTKEEAKGTPHDKDFSKLDKNSDGKLSPQEHAAAPEHQKAAAGGSAESKKPESTGTSKPKY